jgi:PAS domain S-box-containing protein
VKDKDKTKEQLVNELIALRQRVGELELLKTEHKRAKEAVPQRSRELALLNQVSQVFSSGLDLEQILIIVIGAVRRLLDASICSLWLIDSKTNELVCRWAIGFRYEIVQGWRLAPGQGITGWVTRSGKSLIVADTRADERHFKEIDRRIGMELRSILSIPLQAKQRVIGTFDVADTDVDYFNANDLMLLESVVAITAIAIENGRLYEQAQQAFAERKQVEAEIKARAHQQAVVAELGQYALVSDDLTALTHKAVTLITQILNVEYSLVLQLLPDRDVLLLRAGVGWPEELVGQLTVDANPGSQVGYTLFSSAPVVVEDLNTETRFSGPPLLDNHKIVSGMSVIIDAQDWPFGVLGAHTTRPRTFSQDDIHFLQAVANVLAAVIERRQAEKAFRDSEERLRAFANALPDFAIILDKDGRHVEILTRPENLQFVSAVQRKNRLLHDVLPKKEADLLLAVVRRTIETDQSQTLEYALNVQARRRWFEGRTSPLHGITPKNEMVVLVSRDITARKALEEMWRRYEFIVNTSKDFMTLIDKNYTYEAVNNAYAKVHGKTPEEIIGMTVADVWGEEQYLTRIKAHLDKCFAGSEAYYQNWFEFAALGRRYFDVVYYPYRNREELVTHVVVVSRDITEHKQLEEQLLQSQKMEAIGRLAGGVAHDFNNLLTAIMGHVGLALEMLAPDDPARSDIQDIQHTAERAANLTRHLLAFARKQIIKPKILNLNDLILDIDKMLRRLIGADVELVTLPAPDLGRVKVDPGQFEQVLVNLVLNARDAMPKGGKLTIETANVTLDQDNTHRYAEMAPGKYVMLTVSDSGIGISEEVKAHIFEPFFTTKEVGKGSGLGLATCFGIVKQSGGHIWVYSELGQGTTFKICLLRVEETVDSPAKHDASDNLPVGTETILLVEDEVAVRALAAQVLRMQGYTVLTAANGNEALRLAQDQAETEIQLLVTDVVMPQMGGTELADRIRVMRPNINVLFMSGYTDSAIIRHDLPKPGSAFLPKPFLPSMLIHKIRDVLDMEV